MLERGGATVRLAGFCRDDRLSDQIAVRQPFVLGRSSDAALLQRGMATLKNAFLNRDLKNFFSACDRLLVRNLEQLAISAMLIGSRPLVYECLDIHRSLVSPAMPARLIQQVEARLLPRVDMLLTSSPAFVEHHFSRRPVSAPIHLIENKLLIVEGQLQETSPAPPQLPIRIGWFGMLRCKKSFNFLSQLAAASNGRVEVLICGKPSPAELPTLVEDAAKVPGITYTGPYTYDDLPSLYGQCHFAWSIDWFEEGLNSSWLLPNRLYEALSHGVVPIALAKVEVGRWLAAHACGLLVDEPDDVFEYLTKLKVEDLAAFQRAAKAIPIDKLVAQDADCQDLVHLIRAARH